MVGRLRGVDAENPQHPLALVELANGARVKVPFDVLYHHDDGGYSMAGRWSELVQVTGDSISLPVIEERVKVDVRPAPPTSVRVRRRVVSENRVIETPVWHEHVEVERVPIDQFVDVAPEPHRDGDTLVIPCVEEVVVTRLLVREELHVRVVREQRMQRDEVTVRRHELEIERTRTPASPTNPNDHEGEDL